MKVEWGKQPLYFVAIGKIQPQGSLSHISCWVDLVLKNIYTRIYLHEYSYLPFIFWSIQILKGDLCDEHKSESFTFHDVLQIERSNFCKRSTNSDWNVHFVQIRQKTFLGQLQSTLLLTFVQSKLNSFYTFALTICRNNQCHTVVILLMSMESCMRNCETQSPGSGNWLSSSIFTCLFVRPSAW